MVVKRLNYEFVPAGKNIIEYGQVGEKFYMIIRGKVNVLIPKNYRKSVLELNRHREDLKNRLSQKIQDKIGKSLAQKFAFLKDGGGGPGPVLRTQDSRAH